MEDKEEKEEGKYYRVYFRTYFIHLYMMTILLPLTLHLYFFFFLPSFSFPIFKTMLLIYKSVIFLFYLSLHLYLVIGSSSDSPSFPQTKYLQIRDKKHTLRSYYYAFLE